MTQKSSFETRALIRHGLVGLIADISHWKVFC